MLRITLNNADLDLLEDIQIEFTVLNPLFSESGFDEAYSYSFTAPKTARNNGIINRMKSKYGAMKIIFSNILIDSGTGLVKTNRTNYSIDFKNESIDLKQKFETVSLKSLPLETITVCEDSDSATTKLTKWYEHMTQVTVTDAVGSGSHKFPPIRAWDEAADSAYFTEWYAKNPNWDFKINTYYNGAFLKNVGYPLAYNDSQPSWWQSASPCIRIQYLFDQLITFLNINRTADELADVAEFQQLVHYSTLVMDKVETEASMNYNVHGTTIDLVKFTPGLFGIDLVTMLDELFGIFFSYRGGKLRVRLKKNIFTVPVVDYSKYCDPDYQIEHNEGKSILLKYAVELDLLDRFGGEVWESSVLQGAVATSVYQHENKKLGTKEESEEKELSYIPMMSRINWIDFVYPAAYDGIIVEELGLITTFHIPIHPISKYYEEQDYVNVGGVDQFIIGLIRGKYPIKNYTHNVWADKLVVNNSRKFDPATYTEDHQYTFGTCSIFAKDSSSHVDIYLKKHFDFLLRAKTITKTLYLPLHKILEIREWQEPNHIIKQRNLSFKGTVKEINFTLYKNGVSPCTVKYAVVDPEKVGDFNNDYNDDFLI